MPLEPPDDPRLHALLLPDGDVLDGQIQRKPTRRMSEAFVPGVDLGGAHGAELVPLARR